MKDLISLDQFRAEAAAAGRDLSVGHRHVFRVNVGQPKALDDGSRKIRFCFSDGSVDRAGDTINPEGWDINGFMKNPVALWAHNASEPPIGRASRVLVEDSKLMGDIEFAGADVYPFAETIYQLTRGGFISAVSVGFLPIDWKWADDEKDDRGWGIDFQRQELLEISVVPVPCNANALIEARAKGIDTRPLVEWAERTLDGGGKVIVPRAEIERLRGAAQPALAQTRQPKPKEGGSMSESDPAAGGFLGSCGRDKSGECGMKNPAECSIHGPDYQDKEDAKRMKTLVRRLVRAEVRAALRRKEGEPSVPNEERESEEEPLENTERECVRCAQIHMKAAQDTHDAAVDLHEDGDHKAAMELHKAVSEFHQKALDLLDDVAATADHSAEPPGGDEGKQARLRRLKEAREHIKDLLGA